MSAELLAFLSAEIDAGLRECAPVAGEGVEVAEGGFYSVVTPLTPPEAATGETFQTHVGFYAT
jgi:hypothetical protein